MQYCSRCGAPIEGNVRFCGSCGEMFTQPDTMAQVSYTAQNPGLGMKFKIIAGALLAVVLITGGFLGWNNFSSQAQVEKKLELAVKYLSENKYEEAILAYNEAIKIDPKNVEARVGLARAYIGVGDFQKAEKAVATAQDIGSLTPEQYQKIVEAYIKQGRFEEAERLLAEARQKYAANTIIADTEKLLNQEKAQAEALKNPPPAPVEAPAQPEPIQTAPPKPIPAPVVDKPDSGYVSSIY